MTKVIAETALQKASPKYLIIGMKPDGSRGLPVTYVNQIAVSDEASILDNLQGFEQVRVFELTEVGDSDDWLKRRNEAVAAKTVKEEKELLQKLKDKYENG